MLLLHHAQLVRAGQGVGKKHDERPHGHHQAADTQHTTLVHEDPDVAEYHGQHTTRDVIYARHPCHLCAAQVEAPLQRGQVHVDDPVHHKSYNKPHI